MQELEVIEPIRYKHGEESPKLHQGHYHAASLGAGHNSDPILTVGYILTPRDTPKDPARKLRVQTGQLEGWIKEGRVRLLWLC
jgi:hypothetical protein